MGKKLLDFKASISDVVQVNPLFSTCRVRVLYTGKNRNMSIITKEAVERAMPTLKNIPIVGEFSEAVQDFKGHGGSIDMDTYKYVHTTKPYGVVPESATYSWETVRGMDGTSRDYLTIEGCYLWTGRYEEAYSIIENGKGQSMEIEITDGQWNTEQEAYQIDNYVYSALCILGDDVEPAFENANVTSYSLKGESFQKEFSNMLSELDTSLTKEKEVNEDMIKKLLEKYSTSMEVLTEKGLKFEEISEEALEAQIAETLGVEVIAEVVEEEVVQEVAEVVAEVVEEEVVVVEAEVTDEVIAEEAEVVEENLAKVDAEVEVTEVVAEAEVADASQVQVEEEVVVVAEIEAVDAEALQARIVELEGLVSELDELRSFKLNIQKAEHETAVQKLFSNFQFTEEDVKDLDVHAFSLAEIEEKCYTIFGRKVASKQSFSKSAPKEESIRLPIGNAQTEEKVADDGYGGLLFAVKEKQ